MGEQPIYTTKAHVFQIDPQTKKNWMPASTVAVSVAFYYDSSRNSYRIISVEGTKAIINSTITPSMTFTKTSQKFGQWSDSRANTVYGLGFATEADLLKFIDKFQEVCELAKQTPTESNGSGEPHSPVAGHPVNTAALHSRNSSVSSNQSDGSEKQQRMSTSSLPTVEYQLKYENDRLKIALAQSSANAKKWEIELQTLKNNNARLTTALQESTANVEEWKKQLAAYKEESAKLKKQTIELEQTANDEQISALQQQLKDTTEQLQAAEQDRTNTTQELKGTLKKLEELSIQEEQNGKNVLRIKELEKENEMFRKKTSSLETEIKQLKSQQSKDRHELLTLHRDIGTKLQDVARLHEKMAQQSSLSQSEA